MRSVAQAFRPISQKASGKKWRLETCSRRKPTRRVQGKDLYRRSMYTFWKRTVPPPSLATFDAPDREKCTARRALTNTPLQALVLMNDPTYVEAARALAQRTLMEVGGNPAKRIQFAFRQATGRKPTPAEVQLIDDLVQKQLDLYRRDKQSAANWCAWAHHLSTRNSM